MAVTQYKVTFFYEGIQPAQSYASSIVGWTETWYYALDGSLDAVLTNPDMSAYIAQRQTFMPSIYRFVWLRVSDEANPRSSKTRAILNGAGLYSGPPAQFLASGGGAAHSSPAPTRFPLITPAQVTCAVLVDFVRLPTVPLPISEPAHHRRFLVRGLPSDMIQGNVIDTSAPSFGVMTNWLRMLGNHEAGTQPAVGQVPRFLLKYHTPVSPKDYPITALATLPADPRQITVSAAGAPAITRGTRVQVSGVSLPDRSNRVWTATADGMAGGPYQLGISRKPLSGTWSGQGRIRVNVFSYNPANQYTVIGMRLKETGRPFRLTRGRRRIL